MARRLGCHVALGVVAVLLLLMIVVGTRGRGERWPVHCTSPALCLIDLPCSIALTARCFDPRSTCLAAHTATVSVTDLTATKVSTTLLLYPTTPCWGLVLYGSGNCPLQYTPVPTGVSYPTFGMGLNNSVAHQIPYFAWPLLVRGCAMRARGNGRGTGAERAGERGEDGAAKPAASMQLPAWFLALTRSTRLCGALILERLGVVILRVLRQAQLLLYRLGKRGRREHHRPRHRADRQHLVCGYNAPAEPRANRRAATSILTRFPVRAFDRAPCRSAGGITWSNSNTQAPLKTSSQGSFTFPIADFIVNGTYVCA